MKSKEFKNSCDVAGDAVIRDAIVSNERKSAHGGVCDDKYVENEALIGVERQSVVMEDDVVDDVELNIYDVLLDDENTDHIFLTDDNGKEYEFEQIAVIPHQDRIYTILKPVGHVRDMDDDEAIVFYVDDEQEPPALVSETCDDVATQIFDEYYDILNDELGTKTKTKKKKEKEKEKRNII